MIPIPPGVRVWIATGHTDMRRGMNSLALLVQEAFNRDPHGGDLYVFRGKSGKLIKILWHDGLGMSPVHLAVGHRRCRFDLDVAASLHARGHRLAQSTLYLAAIGGGMSPVY
jgi:transposase